MRAFSARITSEGERNILVVDLETVGEGFARI
jgi:hypothetical protein